MTVCRCSNAEHHAGAGDRVGHYRAPTPDLADSVAAPIEQQINNVDNMLYMSSASSTGQLTMTVYFSLDTNPDVAQCRCRTASTSRCRGSVGRRAAGRECTEEVLVDHDAGGGFAGRAPQRNYIANYANVYVLDAERVNGEGADPRRTEPGDAHLDDPDRGSLGIDLRYRCASISRTSSSRRPDRPAAYAGPVGSRFSDHAAAVHRSQAMQYVLRASQDGGVVRGDVAVPKSVSSNTSSTASSMPPARPSSPSTSNPAPMALSCPRRFATRWSR
jgi:multidrug efflux pump